MTLLVERADLEDPALTRFVQAHLADLEPISPPESRHALAVDALRHPDVRLWVARSGGALVGTVALARLEAGHEELKTMRTDPDRRGRGIATALFVHALDDARRRGVDRVSLETGAAEFFAPARALYRKHGFEECGPFGPYRADPHSVFMTRTLTAPATWPGRA